MAVPQRRSEWWQILNHSNLTCSANCVITDPTGAGTSITDTTLNVLAVTLLTQSNIKLLEQLNSDNTKLFEPLKLGFQQTINWNKYQTEVSMQGTNQYLG